MKLEKRTDKKFTEGNKRCKILYSCLLDNNLLVTTIFIKITKRIGSTTRDGEVDLAYLHTEETTKILE